jgi:flagellar hook assembly protein FlgD
MIVTILIVLNLKPFTESQNTVYMGLKTDKETYAPGEEVRITFSLINDKPNNISVPSLGYSLEISGPQGVVLIVTESHSSSEPVSVEASSQASVAAYIWNQKDMNGHQVPDGTYTIRVRLLDASYNGSTEIKIE